MQKKTLLHTQFVTRSNTISTTENDLNIQICHNHCWMDYGENILQFHAQFLVSISAEV